MRNESTVDRALRVLLGILWMGGFYTIGPFAWVGLFGLIPLVTGLLGYCPLYHLMGVSTCGKPLPPSEI